MNTRRRMAACIAVLLLGWTAGAGAHFGMLIPSDSMVAPDEPRTLGLSVSFSHPFEGRGMPMERPARFGLSAGGRLFDLSAALQPATVMGAPAWQAAYRLRRPGAHTFFTTPQPYWEAAEACYILHYAKTVVAAFGDDAGWDTEIGLETEIVPLTRPFGLYAGNVFQGLVKLDGRPVPFAVVEVEYFNADGRAQAPAIDMRALTLKADPNGVFTYAVPAPGWWGFAALNTADYRLDRDGQPREVELGAVLWVRFDAWRSGP